MDHKNTLSFAKELATGPHTEPDESSSRLTHHIYTLILSSHLKSRSPKRPPAFRVFQLGVCMQSSSQNKQISISVPIYLTFAVDTVFWNERWEQQANYRISSSFSTEGYSTMQFRWLHQSYQTTERKDEWKLFNMRCFRTPILAIKAP